MIASIADMHDAERHERQSAEPAVSSHLARGRTPSSPVDLAQLTHGSSSSHYVYSQAQMRPSTSDEQMQPSMRHSSPRNNNAAAAAAALADEDDEAAAGEDAQLTFVSLHDEPRRATNGSLSSAEIGGGQAPTPAYSRKTTATADEQRDHSRSNDGRAEQRVDIKDKKRTPGDKDKEEEEEEHPDGPPPEYTHFAHKLLPGPPCVRNILGSELCERFSWYGLRAILVLYFNHSLGWSKDASISMFSYSSALAYFMPLLGGYLSDSRLGKYRTILYFSMLYVGGCTMLAVSALDRTVWLSILGLVFIGVGTGGIKPCVSSFGADQFTQRRCINAAEVAHREHEISSFFHFFYFSINLGSVGSFIVTPLLRQYFGYSVAFAVPAVLLAIATLIFWSARNTYYRSPPAGSVLTQLWHTFGVAWNRRGTPLPAVSPSAVASARAPHNWIDRASGDASVTPAMVENAKSLWRVLPIFAVLPVFWMLFNQQSSSWTLQAADMKLYSLQPEQVGVVNPVLIMILLPLFDRVVYPAMGRCFHFTPLRRMGLGMVISVLAFLLSAGVQYKVTASAERGELHTVSVFWQLPQIFLISVAEILISVTGLEFAYTQAAPQLKSCITAVFLITSAIGDLLTGVLFTALSRVLSSTLMLVFFAGLMALNFLAFLYVSARYRPVVIVDQKVRSEEEVEEAEEEESRAKQHTTAHKDDAHEGDRDDGSKPHPLAPASIEMVTSPRHHVKQASSTVVLPKDVTQHDDEV